MPTEITTEWLRKQLQGEAADYPEKYVRAMFAPAVGLLAREIGNRISRVFPVSKIKVHLDTDGTAKIRFGFLYPGGRVVLGHAVHVESLLIWLRDDYDLIGSISTYIVYEVARYRLENADDLDAPIPLYTFTR